MSAIKRIAVHVDGGSRDGAVLRLALAVAARHGAELEAVFARIPPFIPASVDGILTPQIVEAQQSIYVQRAENAKKALADISQGAAVRPEWTARDGPALEVMIQRARFADLAIIGQPAPEESDAVTDFDLPAELVMELGRPVLIVPNKGEYAGVDKRVVLAAPRTIAFGFLKTGPNEWQVEAYARPNTNVVNGAASGGLLATGEITFNTDGTVAGVTGDIGAAFEIEWAATTGAEPQDIVLDLDTGMTQFAKSFGVTSVTADGVPPGDLVGLVLEGDGMLTAQFSNGRARALYQIPLATFLNPNGLAADQGGAFRTTLESGLYNINSANAGGAGRIVSGALEASNVDLAAEFTNLITTQRAYSAASRIITTADEMLEELLMIKR